MSANDAFVSRGGTVVRGSLNMPHEPLDRAVRVLQDAIKESARIDAAEALAITREQRIESSNRLADVVELLIVRVVDPAIVAKVALAADLAAP